MGRFFIRSTKGILSRMKSFRLAVAFPLFILFFFASSLGCSSNNSGGSAEGITLRIVHQENGTPLESDQLIYTNAAGDTYSVTKFEYLISNLELSHSVSGAQLNLTNILYGNAVTQGDSQQLFQGLAAGSFDTLSFVWGVPPTENISGALPVEYSGMEWPPQFGGGYHAMRFEGNWTDLNPGDTAYVLHAGHLRRCTDMMIPYASCPPVDQIDETGMAEISLPISSITTGANRHWTVVIVVEVQNWLNNPIYNFGQLWSDPSLCPPSFAQCTLGYPTMMGPEPQSMMRANSIDVFSVTASES